jgi:hypothetical protein
MFNVRALNRARSRQSPGEALYISDVQGLFYLRLVGRPGVAEQGVLMTQQIKDNKNK